jgi:uncharacterized protein
MQTLEEIKAIINAERPRIEARYPLRLLSIFGSYARGEQTEESDVDVLAEKVSDELSLLQLVAAQHALEDSLLRKVDLVLSSGLKPYLKDRVLREAQPL